MRRKLDSWSFDKNSDWLRQLKANREKNQHVVQKMIDDTSLPLNYYAAYKPIKDFIQGKDVLIVNEGANTMDIGRTMLSNSLPRRRLDAGTFGTMGVGLGYALAAGFYCRDYAKGTRVLVVQGKNKIYKMPNFMFSGDSAFGFSGMELETIARYKLPITVVILNNNGISSGFTKDVQDGLEGDRTTEIPVTGIVLLRYEY